MLEVEFKVISAEKVSLDFKYAYLDVIKDDFSSGGGDSKVEQPASKTEENETLGEYISNNSFALFSLSLRSVSVLDSNSSIGLVSVLISFYKFFFWLASVLASDRKSVV